MLIVARFWGKIIFRRRLSPHWCHGVTFPHQEMKKLYERYVLPSLIDRSCSLGQIMKTRLQIVPMANGRVLEIGIGTGLNLGFYDAKKVTAIVGVDPATHLHKLTQRRAAGIGIPVETVGLELGEIQAPDHGFDSIVCTFTLCSIPDAGATLNEMRRVLKPGGKLLFAEHGLAPDEAVARWQHRLTPIWKPLAGGCHLNRDIPALISAGGFHIEELHTGYLGCPRPMTFVYRGWAR